MKEYIDVLKKWKDFDGRARRREYWMFVLFMAIFAIVASIIDAILGTICVFVGIYYLAMRLPKENRAKSSIEKASLRRRFLIFKHKSFTAYPLDNPQKEMYNKLVS